MSIQEDKRSLRRVARERLRNFSLESQRAEISSKTFHSLSQVPEFSSAKVVAAFLDFQNEIPISDFFHLLYEPFRTVAAPRCVGNDMIFYPIDEPASFDPGTRAPILKNVERNAYGILEPNPLPDANVPPQDFDFIIVPGLAFDRAGRRLGRGKGFYDKFLKQTNSAAVRVALAYDFQIVPTVPTEEYDQRVDYVATPTQLICTHQRLPK